jgi:multidrug transporter EmrE-like cation transporter
VFEEPLRFMSGVGIVLILAAVVVLNVKGKERNP